MIHGLDINPFYQEQADYGKLIDWPALKADPLGFRFIWIKVAEGTDGENYVEGAAREVRGAKSVKFEAVNPYHYYLYQWCDWSSGAAVWRVISASEQARLFYFAAEAAGFSLAHPMTDIEDPLISQFLQWSDTASANAAISFARKFNAHLKAYHQAVTDLFGVRPDIYTGAWYLNKYVPLLIDNGYINELAWMGDYKFILADYVGGLDIPYYIKLNQVIAWQKTSSPVPPVQGIPTGRALAGDALDIDQWMGTDAEFDIWCGKKQETTMAGINNINAPIAQRGWLGWISYDDKNVDMTNLCAGVDGLFLGMCSQEVSGMVMYKDGAFPIYAARATKPTFAVVTMDQDLFWKKEIDLPKFQGRDMWANETIRAIIDQWRSKPIPENEWNIHKLNITATDGGWLPISALVLYMSTTVNPTHGSPINGMWQQAIVTDITKVLTSLMQGKYIPTVKIMVAANEDWWTTYAADTNWAPLKDGTISGLGIMRMWGKEVAGLPTELGPMATPAATVAELRQYVPADTYAYPEALKKFTFDFFVYSYNRLRAEGMFYSAKTITPLTAAVWRDTPADLVTFLGAATPPVPPVPPVDPTPDLTALTTRVTALEAQVVALTDVINEITLWAYSIPKFQGPG